MQWIAMGDAPDEVVKLYSEDYIAAKLAGHNVDDWMMPEPKVTDDLFLLLEHTGNTPRVQQIMKPDGTYEPVIRKGARH